MEILFDKEIPDEKDNDLSDMIDRSLIDSIKKAQTENPRPEVLEAFAKSLLTYDYLYDKLSKL